MEKLLEWEAPEYTEHKKNADWYWYLALIAVLLLIFAVYQRSFLFGALIIIGWFTIMLYSARSPRIIKISIEEQGIFVEQNLYQWLNVKSFWIFNNKKEISLELKKNNRSSRQNTFGRNQSANNARNHFKIHSRKRTRRVAYRQLVRFVEILN